MAYARFDIRKFRKLQAAVKRDALRPIYRGWGIKYLTWIKRLYIKNSRGGGDWAPLKSISYRRATGTRKKSRNWKKTYGKAKVKTQILRDTGILFGALSIGQPGNLFKFIRKGIRVGFSGAPHSGSKVTIKQIAIKHQKGDSKTNLPKRKILHEPDLAFKNRMLMDLKKGIQKIGRSL